MSIPRQDNNSSLPLREIEWCRQVVAIIERELDTKPKFQFTTSMLTAYERDLTEVITALQRTPDQEVIRVLRSKVAVLESLRGARDELALALIQLTEKGGRGQNRQFFNALNKCRRYLEEVLGGWFLYHYLHNTKPAPQPKNRTIPHARPPR